MWGTYRGFAIVFLHAFVGACSGPQSAEVELFDAARANDTARVGRIISSTRIINVNAQQDPVGETALHKAAERGNIEVVRMLLEAGADVNLTTRDSEGPLHISAYYGYLEVAKLLLDSGAKVGEKTATNGFAPIHLSVYKRHLSVTELLAGRGANVCDRTDDGRTAITMARRTGLQEFIAWADRNGEACE